MAKLFLARSKTAMCCCKFEYVYIFVDAVVANRRTGVPSNLMRWNPAHMDFVSSLFSPCIASHTKDGRSHRKGNTVEPRFRITSDISNVYSEVLYLYLKKKLRRLFWIQSPSVQVPLSSAQSRPGVRLPILPILTKYFKKFYMYFKTFSGKQRNYMFNVEWIWKPTEASFGRPFLPITYPSHLMRWKGADDQMR